MDKTRDSTNSKIWPDWTCAISVRRKGQILLVVESLVLSTTNLGCSVLPDHIGCRLPELFTGTAGHRLSLPVP